MSVFEIFLIAVGLSMDSLAVSVTGGVVLKRCSACNVVKIGAVMALFQAGMAVGGYLCGLSFRRFIESFDHWIAFFLLLYLGGKMVRDSFQEKSEEEKINLLENRTLCGLALATSIDALAVGISLAIMNTSLLELSFIIAVVTFLFSVSGVYFGHKIGERIDFKLDLIGGLILIGIGCKILAEHLLEA